MSASIQGHWSHRGRSLGRVAIGALLGGFALWLTLKDVEFEELRRALMRVDPLWSMAALLASLSAMGIVAVRWWLLLLPEPPPVGLLLRATAIGQMLNIVLPMRGGEVARIWSVASETAVTVPRVAGSLALEKALDVIVFGGSTAFLATVVVPPSAGSGRPVVIGAALALAGVTATSVALRRFRGGHGWRRTRIGRTIEDALTPLVAALSDLRAGAMVLVTTLLSLLVSALANQFLLSAFALETPWWTGLLILVGLQAGGLPPSLPGRIGVYNYVTVLALGAVGVDPADAAAYSVVLYLVAYVPKLVIGSVLLAHPAWRPARLRPTTTRG